MNRHRCRSPSRWKCCTHVQVTEGLMWGKSWKWRTGRAKVCGVVLSRCLNSSLGKHRSLVWSMQIDLWACVWSGHARGIHLLISSTKASTVLYVHNKQRCLNWRPPFVIMLYLAFPKQSNPPFSQIPFTQSMTRIAGSFESSFNFTRIKADFFFWHFHFCSNFHVLLILCYVPRFWQSQSLQLSSAIESFQNMTQELNNSQNICQSLVPPVKFTSSVEHNWAFGWLPPWTTAGVLVLIIGQPQRTTSFTVSAR